MPVEIHRTHSSRGVAGSSQVGFQAPGSSTTAQPLASPADFSSMASHFDSLLRWHSTLLTQLRACTGIDATSPKFFEIRAHVEYWRQHLQLSSIHDAASWCYAGPGSGSTPGQPSTGLNSPANGSIAQLANAPDSLKSRSFSLQWTQVIISAGIAMCQAAAVDSYFLVGGLEQSGSSGHKPWYPSVQEIVTMCQLYFPRDTDIMRRVQLLQAALSQVRQLVQLYRKGEDQLSLISRYPTFHCYGSIGESVQSASAETHKLPPTVFDPLTAVDSIHHLITKTSPESQSNVGGSAGTGTSHVAVQNQDAGPMNRAGEEGALEEAKEVPIVMSISLKPIVSPKVLMYDPRGFAFFTALSEVLYIRALLPTPTATSTAQAESGLLSTSRLHLNMASEGVHAILVTAFQHLLALMYTSVERYPLNAVSPFGYIAFLNDVMAFLSRFDLPFAVESVSEVAPSQQRRYGGGSTGYGGLTAANQLRGPPGLSRRPEVGAGAPNGARVPLPQPGCQKECMPYNILHMAQKMQILVGIGIEKLKHRITTVCQDSVLVEPKYTPNPRKTTPAAGAGASTAASTTAPIPAPGTHQEPLTQMNTRPGISAALAEQEGTEMDRFQASQSLWNILVTVMEPIGALTAVLQNPNGLLVWTLLSHSLTATCLALRQGAIGATANVNRFGSTGQSNGSGSNSSSAQPSLAASRKVAVRTSTDDLEGQLKVDAEMLRRYLIVTPNLSDTLKRRLLGHRVWRSMPSLTKE